MSNSRPNFLCFVLDQLRADHLACYGNRDILTPHIDRLAGEGLAFTEAYVANPVCMPNRASLFTGRYPKAHGLRENGIALASSEQVVPEVLRQAGYRTAAFGKIHLAPFGFGHNPAHPSDEREQLESMAYWAASNELPLPYYGFEHVYFVGGHGHYVFGQYKNDLERNRPGMVEKLAMEAALAPPTGAVESWKSAIPAEYHYNTAIADETITFLEDLDQTEPFFVWCSFPDPHHPYCPPRPYCDQYDPSQIEFVPARRDGEFDSLPTFFRECYEGKVIAGWCHDLRQVGDEELREILAHTYGMVTMVDANIGRVLDTLEEQGFQENTVVVLLSDHGDLMGDHWLIQKGPFPYRGLVRVPFIWRLPQMANRGTRSDALISAVDFLPTILDLAGIPLPEAGRLVSGHIDRNDLHLPNGIAGRSIAGLLHESSGPGREHIYIECDSSDLGDRLRSIRSRDWSLTYYAIRNEGVLFDLRQDPDELVNLWLEPAYQEIRNELMAALVRESALADDWLPPRKTLA